MFAAGTVGAAGMMALGAGADGDDVRAAGDGAVGAVSDGGAVYGELAGVLALAGIFGASLAPYVATWLARRYGLEYVGYYLSGSALLTLVGLLMIRETGGESLEAAAGGGGDGGGDVTLARGAMHPGGSYRIE